MLLVLDYQSLIMVQYATTCATTRAAGATACAADAIACATRPPAGSIAGLYFMGWAESCC